MATIGKTWKTVGILPHHTLVIMRVLGLKGGYSTVIPLGKLDQKGFALEIVHKSRKSNARVCKIHTPHGFIDTPGFVPVGTNGALKGIPSKIATDQLNTQLIFCNTYHLLVHPGLETIKRGGGIHKYMGYKGPIITDSGGFQVFSLACTPDSIMAFSNNRSEELKKGNVNSKYSNNIKIKVSEEGVYFTSYRDGSEIYLSAESSISSQKAIGADFIVSFDELLPHKVPESRLRESFDRTHRWQDRSLLAHKQNPTNQLLCGIIHGGLDLNLRNQSLDFLIQRDFEMLSIGGSLGTNEADVETILNSLTNQFPEHLPRHLLGIGDVTTISSSVPFGIDTFDSSYPTKLARHGSLLLLNKEKIFIGHSQFKNDHESLDPGCQCYTCLNHTKAYLHHLFKAYEPTFGILSSTHNIHTMMRTMECIRQSILKDEI